MTGLTSVIRLLALVAAISAFSAPAATAQGLQESWRGLDAALGRAGSPQPGEVRKYSLPRSDLRVMVGEVAVKPALALGSWVAFKETSGSDVIAMGDLVLLESEVAPVISKLQSMGVEQTALHNHLQHESPAIVYLHIQAHGDRVKIGRAVRAALALTKTPLAQAQVAGPTAFALDTAKLASVLGHAGRVNGGVYQVTVPRTEMVRMGGTEIPPSMGVASVLNFQPTGNGKAAITGDFVLTADEVTPVIRSLRDGGVEVTALHSHMLGEEPRVYFMHFWANDDASKLAKALHLALGQMKVAGRGT